MITTADALRTWAIIGSCVLGTFTTAFFVTLTFLKFF